jgi:dihydroorotate dehydrogenase electron transfer subunit
MHAGNRHSPRGVYAAEVVVNRRVCEEHYLLTLDVPGLPPTRPGQFVQLLCRKPGEIDSYREHPWRPGRGPALDGPELTGDAPLLRRPFSLADDRREGDTARLDLIYRAVGEGTRRLSRFETGEPVSVLGPLGNGFVLRDEPLAVLAGGGVGIPPMIYLARRLVEAGREVVVFCGVRGAELLPVGRVEGVLPAADAGLLPCLEPFAGWGVSAAVTTDDGSLGLRGYLDSAVARLLEERGCGGGDAAVYACGPEAMMRAVGEDSLARNLSCQLALERHMACGMGTCQSCVVRIRDDSPAGWSYRLCCTDGPVFEAAEVLW